MGVEKDFSFGKLHSEAFSCIQCGYCRRVCPVYRALGWESTSPRNKVYQLQNLLSTYPPLANLPEEFSQRFWQCTNCRRCTQVCPTHLDLMNLWQGVKHHLGKKGYEPASLRSTRERVKRNKNIFSLANENRSFWAMSLQGYPKVLKPENPDIAVFVGCVASFYPLVSGIPLALANVFLKAGVKAYFLGADEHCCGNPLTTAGDLATAEILAENNISKVRELGVDKLVFICPSCQSTWLEEYPRYNKGQLPFRLLHYTEYLADLVDQGGLDLKPYPRRVSYHDSCDLGRHLGIYEAPRRILRAIPELEFVELANHHQDSLCCGAGGNLYMVDQKLANKISQPRLDQIEESGIDTLVTACAECRQVFTLGLQDRKSPVRVLDIAELVAELIREG